MVIQSRPFSLSSFSLFFFCTSILLVSGIQVVLCSAHHHHHHHHHSGLSKLFVFGDSYADTGNTRKSASNSWAVPYGITFPGKPVGRFSDGRVLTDYLASFIGIKSPIPYRWRKIAANRIRYGMNFAFGGTGVFDTVISPDPNMTVQIDFLQNLVNKGVYTKRDLASSVALVSLAGNDYSSYFIKNGSFQNLPTFITSVVNQLSLNLNRIRGLGVRKIAVTSLEPLGCLPRSAVASSFSRCNETENQAVGLHNSLLREAVTQLNTRYKGSPVVILDLYSAFTSVLTPKSRKNHPAGSLTFENPLKPCCVGTSAQFNCGSVDEKGVKRYTVCDNPGSAFFWDTVHPTQRGWLAIYSALQASLDQLYSY